MHSLEKLQKLTVNEKIVELYYPFQGKVRITSPRVGMFHLAFLKVTDWSEESYEPSSSVLLEESYPLNVEDRKQELVITISGGKAIVAKEPFGVRFLDAHDHVVAHSPKGLAYQYDGWRVRTSFMLPKGEIIYGLGESDVTQSEVLLNHRGKIRPIWNKHLPAPSRLLIPVLYSSAGYGLFIDNSWTARFDFGVEQEEHWFYEADGGVLNYYIFFGENLAQLVDQYTQLTGRPELPPLWTFGFLQSKFGYRTRTEVEQIVTTFRTKQIPCDAMIIDLYWFKSMGDLTFDLSAFPNPQEMVTGLKAKGFHTILIEEPYITKESRLFAEGDRHGYFGKRSDGTSYTFPFWPGESALVDFTNSDAREWWGKQHQDLMEIGIAGWWTDLNEPEVHPADMIHYSGPAQEVHNRYALEMHQSIAQAHKQQQGEKRLWIMSRSAWAGSQRYGVGVWSGDVDTTWDHLQKQISLGLSMGLAGIPLWNTDIGGFKGEEPSAELYVRWIQFGAFTPTMRPHGAQQQREPWAFGEQAEAIIKRYIELRYQLLPYLYAAAYEAYQTGIPYMRPLSMEEPDNVRLARIHDQYFFGNALLVAPVVEEGASRRQVCLPKGNWYDFWTGKRVTGGKTIRYPASLEILPLFVREGSIIPMIPVMQHVHESPWSDLTFHLYPAQRGQFLLYEDDGVSTAYKNGAFRTTLIDQKVNAQTWTITVGAGIGSYDGMINERHVEMVLYDVAQVHEVRVDGRSWNALRHVGEQLVISLGKNCTDEERIIEVIGLFLV